MWIGYLRPNHTLIFYCRTLQRFGAFSTTDLEPVFNGWEGICLRGFLVNCEFKGEHLNNWFYTVTPRLKIHNFRNEAEFCMTQVEQSQWVVRTLSPFKYRVIALLRVWGPEQLSDLCTYPIPWSAAPSSPLTRLYSWGLWFCPLAVLFKWS
jgi:hypothetical protein